ncbi:MAG TPA: murein biosynthesis integral membrane protein MurJ [Candidatus Limnocylindrales bacterium]|nr:murein biosynthesis integral membrane protein MurJ [Candidatus Limnocylindrales bacterium]
MTVKGQILKSASVIAFVTAISRICGYLRDQRVALLLGTSPAADAFILAFRIPNLFRRMAGGGALSASFIPVFTGYLRDKPRSEAMAFARRLFWIIAAVMAVVGALGCIFSKQVVFIFTLFGGSNLQWNLAVFLNRIIFPGVLFVGLAALATGILNSFQIFGLPAATSVFFNLTVILFSFGFIYGPITRWAPASYKTPAVALAVGVLAGTAVQFFAQVPPLVRRGMNFKPEASISDPGVRKVGRLLGPAAFGMGVYQINFFIDTIFATSSRMPTGSVASLYIADRVMELVLGSYAIAMSTALLPMMSHQAAAGKFGEMKNAFAFSLRVVSFITIPAAVGLILLRRPVIQVLFQHGKFVAESTALTAHALLFYALGLPAYAGIKLITPMYYSTHDTATPARVGVYILALNVALNACFLVFLFRYLTNGTPALASSIAAYFNFLLLFAIFRKRHGRLGGKELVRSVGKMAICAAGMAAACVAGLRYTGLENIERLGSQAGVLAAMIAMAVAVYFGLARLLRCEELPEFLLLLRRGEPAAIAAPGVDA